MKYIILVAALACLASAASIDDARLLPSQPPELPLNRTEITLNNTLIVGSAVIDQGIIRGLDSMTDTLTFNVLTFVLKGDINIPAVGLSGLFEIDALASLSNGTTIDLQGAGLLDASATGVFLNLNINFDYNIITTKIKIGSMDATPRIAGCAISAPDATANGQPIDFATLCAEAPALIDEYWVVHKATILLDIQNLCNEFLKDMTLQDLIDLIGGGRVKMIYE